MDFDFIQFWLDGRPGNEYFCISHKISDLLTPLTPLSVHPQWFESLFKTDICDSSYCENGAAGKFYLQVPKIDQTIWTRLRTFSPLCKVVAWKWPVVSHDVWFVCDTIYVKQTFHVCHNIFHRTGTYIFIPTFRSSNPNQIQHIFYHCTGL